MMRIVPIWAWLLLFSIVRAHASDQDTIRIMTYNLLYYGINTSFCNANNNNADLKDGHLQTIVSFTQPDILGVNEMGRGAHLAARILDQAMNSTDLDKYSHASYTNTRNSSITNMLFFRHDKFALYHEAVISNEVRDINLYTLYHLNESLEQGDTIFLSLILAHLKAGSSNADQQTRLLEVKNVMNYISTYPIPGNIIFMGDFNMKSSFEAAYGLMTFHPDESIRFYDPVYLPGIWIDNPDMAAYHTQSIRTGSVACFVAGGLDDRFDQILINSTLLKGREGLRYAEGSYTTVGQDGERLNGSLIDPPNYSAPDSVIQALYNMSDHLPVYLDLLQTATSTDVELIRQVFSVSMVNPVRDQLMLNVNALPGVLSIGLFTMSGHHLHTMIDYQTIDRQQFRLAIPDIPPGVYMLRVKLDGVLIGFQKMIKI